MEVTPLNPATSGRRRPQLRGAVGTAGGFEGDGGPAERALPGGGFGRRRLLFPFHTVDALDHQEHGRGDDEKTDDAAPMTLPMAMSTTLPRMINSLKSLNISCPPVMRLLACERLR